MSGESEFISRLRSLAGVPAARGLMDDAAVLDIGGGRQLVLTHDILVEGVHFLAADRPEDVAWKLVAVNLSDLAAKGARPVGILMGYTLSSDDWNGRFAAGLEQVLEAFGLALLGGDTVSAPTGAPRSFGLTAIGEAEGPVPSRAGGRPGDLLWVSGTIGDAGAGLKIATGAAEGPDVLVERYRRPRPRLALGRRLAPFVSAMMDVSDGLLIDTSRMALASGAGASVELRDIPLSKPLLETFGDTAQVRSDAATAGDDYELLFAASPDRTGQILEAARLSDVPVTAIGRIAHGEGVSLTNGGAPIPLPERLGYEHGGRPA